jgi:hypothetical protein
LYILKFKPDAFGFFYCKITSPEYLTNPILQVHYKEQRNKLKKTISPLGTWEGMYFSEELTNAAKFGYQFEVLWAYTFERKNIFKDYITILQDLRIKYPKSDPMNYIAKKFINFLYGRFGMKDKFERNLILKN